ncbi:sialoadhesin isoform X1 [Ictalurus punctatus]|uniref:Sialoadhesin isoform X1 n=1 Tax=Ictalurus punctatus TaxID=7998 RepID=A0A9F7RLM9_ICTPU|nr:sialoadhesin isoform X1 [Ictalurus punctatus]XP_053543164.1 sialoadhesin isoform X1 [Ictalurus punctatus]XP_053543165.1 sialoadhesin isoform X1 [Ictalurus punctatus]XP_053543166.1 sialoadhesin isoform X1 [Ictalurus punctatus]XP_053543167.1 sialoadhesin isoform X1 [Ictalurus punctatus]XP_053543169.1 sialoadhesin isoform X1 [Ictalurus punctatus]
MDPQSKILFCWICLQAIFASVFSDVWKAEVVSSVEALVSSCVVLPCKFSYPGTRFSDSRIKGIWHKQTDRNDRIYDEDHHLIGDNFKGRTKLIGRLSEKNCSLEIDDVKDHDDGPFCFRTELPADQKFSFVEKCVTITMKPEPDQPKVEHDESFTDGAIAIFKCYVRHTCPTHHPTIEWSRQEPKPRLSYKDNGYGVWEVESLLSFTAKEEDDHADITCTVTFHGNKKSAVTKKIFIKRKQNIFHIIIPVAAVLGTIVVFGTTCFFVTKRYKRQIQELQSRNPNGVWSRLSRMSRRVRSVGSMRSRRDGA